MQYIKSKSKHAYILVLLHSHCLLKEWSNVGDPSSARKLAKLTFSAWMDDAEQVRPLGALSTILQPASIHHDCFMVTAVFLWKKQYSDVRKKQAVGASKHKVDEQHRYGRGQTAHKSNAQPIEFWSMAPMMAFFLNVRCCHVGDESSYTRVFC